MFQTTTQQIIRRIVKEVQGQHPRCTINVTPSEDPEDVLNANQSADAIIKAAHSCDAHGIHIYDETLGSHLNAPFPSPFSSDAGRGLLGVYRAWILFIPENGSDCISDYTDNAFTNTLLDPILAEIEKVWG